MPRIARGLEGKKINLVIAVARAKDCVNWGFLVNSETRHTEVNFKTGRHKTAALKRACVVARRKLGA